MKKLYFLLLVFTISTLNLYSQQSSDYFPADGSVWYYYQSILDSNNNPIDSLSIYTADSAVVSGQFYGREAHLTLRKFGDENLIHNLPYIDSVFISTEGSIAGEYLSFLSLIDTSVINDSSFLDLFRQLNGWYDNYRFDETIGNEYNIAEINTSISIEGESFDVRIDVEGERNGSDNVDTNLGVFESEKFTVKLTFNLLVTIVPGFPPASVPVLILNQETWIAPERWIIKRFIPTVSIDLSQFDGPAFTIPGTQLILTEKPVPTSVNNDNGLLAGYDLFQNYPNPFNPETIISYSVPEKSNVKLSVMNILGQELVVLENSIKEIGTYNINFNANYLPSGVYFYKIEAGNFQKVMKMILTK